MDLENLMKLDASVVGGRSARGKVKNLIEFIISKIGGGELTNMVNELKDAVDELRNSVGEKKDIFSERVYLLSADLSYATRWLKTYHNDGTRTQGNFYFSSKTALEKELYDIYKYTRPASYNSFKWHYIVTFYVATKPVIGWRPVIASETSTNVTFSHFYFAYIGDDGTIQTVDYGSFSVDPRDA